jgi:hypothetical protein
MKRHMKWLGAFVAVALLAGAAGAQENDDVWVRMNEDVQIMRRLVSDALSEVRSPRVEEIDEQLGEIRKELEEVEGESRRGERRPESTEGARLRSERSRLQGEKRTLQNVSTSDAMYLPGYGAIVMCRLQVPLSAGPSPAPSPVPGKPSKWEEYKYKALNLPVYGRERGRRKYDKEHVEKLREAAVELLATEAQNFDALPAEEQVTVFLYGPWAGSPAGGGMAAASFSGGEGDYEVLMAVDELGTVYAAQPAPTRSVLIVSVSGADLAAQREGKLSSKDLKKRIEIHQR